MVVGVTKIRPHADRMLRIRNVRGILHTAIANRKVAGTIPIQQIVLQLRGVRGALAEAIVMSWVAGTYGTRLLVTVWRTV